MWGKKALNWNYKVNQKKNVLHHVYGTRNLLAEIQLYVLWKSSLPCVKIMVNVFSSELSFFLILQAFRNELESSKPTVSDGLDYGHHLLEDDDINKEMKSSVAQDIKNLEDDWANLKDADTDEEQRLNFARRRPSYWLFCQMLLSFCPDSILRFYFNSIKSCNEKKRQQTVNTLFIVKLHAVIRRKAGRK